MGIFCGLFHKKSKTISSKNIVGNRVISVPSRNEIISSSSWNMETEDIVRNKVIYGGLTRSKFRDFSLEPGCSRERETEVSAQCSNSISFNADLKAGLDKLGITVGVQAKIERSINNKDRIKNTYVNNTDRTLHYMRTMYKLKMQKMYIMSTKGRKLIDKFKDRVATVTTREQWREMTNNLPELIDGEHKSEYITWVDFQDIYFTRVSETIATEDPVNTKEDMELTLEEAIDIVFIRGN